MGRSSWHRPLALGVLFVLGALGLWAFWIEPERLVVRSVDLAVPAWHRKPLRIAMVSDLHVGSPHVGLERLRSIVLRTNETHPDLIVLLGDFVVGTEPTKSVDPEVIGHALHGLSAPLGVVAVLGNHDWWYGGERVRAALVANGITVLENEGERVNGEEPFWVAGIADAMTRKVDVARALAGAAEGEPVLALAHNPDVFPSVPARVSLTLAAHTHGGQILLPFFGRRVPSRFGERYAYGHVVEGGRHLYVTSGIGTSLLPARFGVPPEIVVVTVRSDAPG